MLIISIIVPFDNYVQECSQLSLKLFIWLFSYSYNYYYVIYIVMANVNFEKRVHIKLFDMQNIMCIKKKLCVAWCKPIGVFFSPFILSLFNFSSFLFEFVLCAMVIMCE